MAHHQHVALADFSPNAGNRSQVVEGQHFLVFHHQQVNPWVIVQKQATVALVDAVEHALGHSRMA